MGAEGATLAKRQRCCKRDRAPACIPAPPPCRGIGTGNSSSLLSIARMRPESSGLWHRTCGPRYPGETSVRVQFQHIHTKHKPCQRAMQDRFTTARLLGNRSLTASLTICC